MDVLEVLELGMIGSRGLSLGVFQLPEFYECCQSIGHLVALLVTVIGLLDVSLDGDDSTRS
jgi:hypothetical protein